MSVGRGLLMVLALVAAGCGRAGPTGRPAAEHFASALPSGSGVAEVRYADLDADGRDEALIAATVPVGAGRAPTAYVFVLSGRRYMPRFTRRVPGDAWLPIQVGHPGDGAPLVAAFAARGGSQGVMGYIVVRHNGRDLVTVLDHSGVFQGNLRFVPEGLLESSGDVDRLLRLGGDGQWQVEELGGQYAGETPPGTMRIDYFVDPARGPMVDVPVRDVRLGVGRGLQLRRTDRGAPSRILFTGQTSAYTIGADGVLVMREPGVFQIHIEGPAFSGRIFTINVQVDP